uniref:Uncharacterized protein n=1 Tax=Fagus sylvatica TaxID=28930 RepID=A0A2N9GC85_FAGSY
MATGEGLTLEYTPTWVVSCCVQYHRCYLSRRRKDPSSQWQVSQEKEPEASLSSLTEDQRRVDAFGVHITATNGVPSKACQILHAPELSQKRGCPAPDCSLADSYHPVSEFF